MGIAANPFERAAVVLSVDAERRVGNLIGSALLLKLLRLIP